MYSSHVLTLFAGDLHSQHSDGDVVLIGAHVLQHSRVQFSFKVTQVIRFEPFSQKAEMGKFEYIQKESIT